MKKAAYPEKGISGLLIYLYILFFEKEMTTKQYAL